MLSLCCIIHIYVCMCMGDGWVGWVRGIRTILLHVNPPPSHHIHPPPPPLQASELDPMLDDAVQMARRLQSLGQEVHFDVMPGMCHGFLAFAGNPDMTKAVGVVTGHIRSALGMSPAPTKK